MDDEYDDEQEIDYGEDDYGEEEQYGFREEDELVDFSFRQMDQVHVYDSELNLPIGSVIESGALANVMRCHELINMDPLTRFKVDVQSLLSRKDLLFGTADESIIKKTIPKMTFIEYKNPILYILGYYVRSFLTKNTDITQLPNTIMKKIQEYTDNRLSLAQVVKYARYWNILLKT